MSKCSALKIIGIIIFVLALSGCSLSNFTSSTPTPFLPQLPNYGVFLSDRGSYIELEQYTGPPEKQTINNNLVSTYSNPIFWVWYPELNHQYFLLVSLDQPGAGIPYKITPKDANNQLFEITPRNPLSDDLYCFYQGDPLGNPYSLPFWCFRVGNGAISNVPAQPTDKPKMPATSVNDESISVENYQTTDRETTNKIVAIVNNEEISTENYQARVKFERMKLVIQFEYTVQRIQKSDDESTIRFLQNDLRQINFQLTPKIHGQAVLNTMVDDVIIRQQAGQFDILVSEAEIDEYTANVFGYFPDGTLTKEVLGVNQQSINISGGQLRDIAHAEILRSKMVEEIGKDTPRDEEQVRASHILVETEEEALAVIERLDSGEDFSQLAKELSTDTGSGAEGGDLGWFGRGRMVPEFEEAAFALEIGEISEPLQSDFGWHIIKKIGHEVRPIDDVIYDKKMQSDFEDWLIIQQIVSSIETDKTWVDVYPETPVISEEYQALLEQ